MTHICPWWGGYFIDHRLRRWLHPPDKIVGPFVREGMTVLDFGCGMGIFALAMARLVGETGEVIAVDLQPQMLAVLVKRAAKAQLADRIRSHQCEVDRLNLETPLDFALAFYSLHEVPSQTAILREIHTQLRPNASLLLVEPMGHVRRAAFEQTLSLAREIGYGVETGRRVRLSHSALLKKL